MQITWKQFKDYLESKGVTDDSPISYIDINGFQLSSECDAEVVSRPEGSVEVYN